jgi:spermidine synthase
MEFLLAGEKLQRCRTAFLPEAAKAGNVLILGEGNARFLAECRRLLDNARITCVDASARMLNLAKKCLKRSGLDDNKVEFIEADVLEWRPPEAAFDLIITHFFLDCFQAGQVESVVSRLSEAAKPAATWLLADFRSQLRGCAVIALGSSIG